jgi:mannose-1-phosphate guanylyltransferase
MKKAYAVVMAGGIGSRFWPMSTASYPKQFHDILGTGESLLQQTIRRICRICDIENVLIVTSKAYESIVQEQLPDLPVKNILCEPARRNTAPCLSYAVAKIAQRDPNAVMLVTPSDSIVTKEAEYEKFMRTALEAAEGGDRLLTLGIRPHRPDTGYGYIQYGEDILEDSQEVHKVKTFTEKPNLEHAKMFLESGDFLWNAGIFIWSVSSIRKAIEAHMPDLAESFFAFDEYDSEKEDAFIDEVYASCVNESIDYGIMEKAENVFVLPAEFGWSDLGTWGSLYEQLKLDKDGNAVVGKKVLLYDSVNNMVRVQPNKTVAIQGLDGFIVVDTDDRLLICRREDEQMIKAFVNDIRIHFGQE